MVLCVKSRSQNVCIKKIILNSSNSDLNLEQWRVEIESTQRKGKRLKSGDIFLVFLYLESRNDQLKEEDAHENEMNRSNTSKLLSKIENLLSVVEK